MSLSEKAQDLSGIQPAPAEKPNVDYRRLAWVYGPCPGWMKPVVVLCGFLLAFMVFKLLSKLGY